MAKETLILVGASVRALAQSAVAAGFNVWSADLFGDRDLVELGPWRKIDDYPHGLVPLLAEAPPGDVIYTGGLENHPDVIEAIGRMRTVLGCSPATLRAVRDPWQLAPVVAAAGFPMPETQPLLNSDIESPPDDPKAPYRRVEPWLIKPRQSGGGSHIVDANRVTDADRTRVRRLGVDGFVRQRWIDGFPLSAQFLTVRGRPHGTRLLGLCRQIGPWARLAGGPFAYRGGIGPWPIWPDLEERLTTLGAALSGQFALTGLYGVDLVTGSDQWIESYGEPTRLDASGFFHVIEINPRFTASMELLEWGGSSLVQSHVAACRGEDLAEQPGRRPRRLGLKAIVYATGSCRWGEDADTFSQRHSNWLADIPQVGTSFRAGQPVTTIRVAGESLRRLRLMTQTMVSRLRPCLDPFDG